MDGRTMLEDVVRGEMAEKELDAFIERRALKTNPEQQRIEDGWAESTRKYNARHREAAWRQRLEWHEAQLARHMATFEALLRRHRVGLRLCEQALGLPISEETKGDAA